MYPRIFARFSPSTCVRVLRVSPFSFSLSSRLWLKAVYKSGRRLYPPTTMYRTDERERHEGGREKRRSRRASTSVGQGGHDRSRCCIRCDEATSMHCGIFRDWNLGRALRPRDLFPPLFSPLDLSCAPLLPPSLCFSCYRSTCSRYIDI